MSLLRPGLLVHCTYPDALYSGIICDERELTKEDILDLRVARIQAHDEPLFFVKFFEQQKVMFDVVPLGKLSLVSDESFERVSCKIIQELKSTKQLTSVDGCFVLTQMLQKFQQTQNIGIMVLPEVVAATHFPISEIFYQNLLTHQILTPSSAVNELIQNLQEGQATFDPNDQVFGRFPNLPNYDGTKFFGNQISADYSAILANNELIRVGGFARARQGDHDVHFKVQRIVSIKQQEGYLVGGVAFVDKFMPVVFPSVMLQGGVAFEIQKDLEISFHSNLVVPLDVQGAVSQEDECFAGYDLKLGNNYAILGNLLLERKYTMLAPATPIEVATAKLMFIQGKLIDIDSNTGRSFKYVKFNNQIANIVDTDLDYDYLPAVLDQVLSELAHLDYESIVTLFAKIVKQRHLRCGFCGKPAELSDSIGPRIFAISMQNTKFSSFYNPPVIAIFHTNCAKYCPEVSTLEFQIDSVISNISFDMDSYHQLNQIMKACVLDRYLRQMLISNQKIVYQELRKVLKSDRIGLLCVICHQPGAVIGCYNSRCQFTAHYQCIVNAGLVFQGKQIFCAQHK